MKFIIVCLAIALLGFGIQAQEGQFTTDEFQENGTEVALMVLEKESNLPVCRLSNQVRINSEFIPEGRIGDVEMASIEETRVCEEEDIWNAVEEEMLVGMATLTPNFAPIVLPMISGGVVGCFMGYMLQLSESITNTGIMGTSNLARLRVYMQMGIPSALMGSLSALMVSFLRTGALPKSTPISFYLTGFGVGVPSTILAGEVCKSLYWD